MKSLLTARVSVKRNGIGYKPGTKIPVHTGLLIHESLPCRITNMKLYVMYKNGAKEVNKIQKGDIIEDLKTEFKYVISDHPQLGGGKGHHWEASLEIFVNE